MKHLFLAKIRSKLAWKMLLIYICLILVPSLLLGLNYFKAVQNYLLNTEKDLVQRTLNRYCTDLDAELEKVGKVYLQLLQHNNFMRFLQGEYSSKALQVSAYVADFSKMFAYCALSSRFIDNITVYVKNSKLLEMGGCITHMDKLKDCSEKELETSGQWRYTPVSKQLVFYRVIRHTSTNAVLGILEIKCKGEILFESLQKLQTNRRELHFVYKNSVFDLNGQEIDKPLPKEIEVGAALTKVPVEVYMGSPSGSRDNDMVFSLLITFACLLILSLVLFAVVYSLSRRIRVFSQSMADESGSPREFQHRGNDELGQLINTYNSMVRNNDYLLSQVRIEKLHQRETEYRMLQSQIDPHFIYNSLEGVRMMAEMHEDCGVADVIFSLSKLMRYSFSVSSAEVTLEMELDYIRQYIKVQNMRTGNRINLEILCEPFVQELSCPKFTVQPVVENAVKYGLIQSSQILYIRIKAEFKEGMLCISVENSGAQIGGEKLEEMNKI